MKSHYCLVISMPPIYHRSTDVLLGGILMSGPLWVEQLNPWFAFVGGIMGLFIASVRVYEIIKGWLHKDETKK